MSLNVPEGRNISETVSHMRMSTAFPEGTVMDVSHNAREIIWDGIMRQIEMPPINSEEGNISVSDSNFNWGHARVWLIKNPLYPLYYKGAYSLALLLFTIIVLTYGHFIPVEISVPIFGAVSIFLLTFIGEIRNKKHVKIGG